MLINHRRDFSPWKVPSISNLFREPDVMEDLYLVFAFPSPLTTRSKIGWDKLQSDLF